MTIQMDVRRLRKELTPSLRARIKKRSIDAYTLTNEKGYIIVQFDRVLRDAFENTPKLHCYLCGANVALRTVPIQEHLRAHNVKGRNKISRNIRQYYRRLHWQYTAGNIGYKGNTLDDLAYLDERNAQRGQDYLKRLNSIWAYARNLNMHIPPEMASKILRATRIRKEIEATKDAKHLERFPETKKALLTELEEEFKAIVAGAITDRDEIETETPVTLDE